MSKAFQIQAYFQYLTQARNQHALHSPFLFKTYQEVIRPRKGYGNISAITDLRNRLQNDPRTLEVTDFGSGGRFDGARKRKIKSIARWAGCSEKAGLLLYRLCKHFRPQKILEMGTSLGISTAYLAYSSPQTTIHTLEGCSETAKLAFENFHRLGLKNIRQHLGEFDQSLPRALASLEGIDLAFIDGNHQYQPTKNYVAQILPHCHSHSILVLHDIHYSPEMEKAWEEIIHDERVKVSLDFFELGVLFFRKGIPKQNFILKY